MIIFFAVLLVLLLGFTISSISGATWVPARAYDIEALLDDAKIKPGSVYIELGCGDGRLVRGAAKRGARAIGYELNPSYHSFATKRLPFMTEGYNREEVENFELLKCD